MTTESSVQEPGFIVENPGPSNLFGVFEDDGETGYLYIYEQDGQGVLRHLHIYDRSLGLGVVEGDVCVKWSEDHSKCGVIIWGKIRGIIDLANGSEGRVWLESKNSPGLGDQKWLLGFELRCP